MSQHEDLSREINHAAFAHGWEPDGDIHEYIARRLIAAGYRKQRTVETVEELTALKTGSVVLDAENEVLSKIKDGYEEAWYSTTAIGGYEDQDISLPATLLWEPAD